MSKNNSNIEQVKHKLKAGLNQTSFCLRWLKILALIVLLLSAAVSAAGCRSRKPSDTEALPPSALSDQIRINRVQEASPRLSEGDIQELLYPYTDLVDESTLERLAFSGVAPDSLKQRFLVFGTLPVNGALEDVDLLFTAFKYSYALYEYFGGDRVFEAARQNLRHAILEQANDRGELTKRVFRQLVLDQLSFIQDGHVVFAGESLFRRYPFYYSEKINFSRDASGTFTLIRGQRYDLVEVAPELETSDPGASNLGSGADSAKEEFLKLSITEDGRLVYILGTVRPDTGRRYPIQVTLAGENETIVERVVLRRESSIVLTQPITYRSEIQDGVRVVVNRNTAPSTIEMKTDLERFVAEATQMAEEEVVILDLRDHQGGQPQPALAWAETLAGEPIAYEQYDVILRTRTALYLQRNFVQWYYRGNESRLNRSLGNITSQLVKLRSYDPGEDVIWTTNHYLDDQPELLPNDTLLLVLMDRGTASAGEDFIYFLKQLENVVFVGENTRGKNLSGEPAWGTLPNSGFSFQVSLDMTLTSAWTEGVGHSPDIWVNPDQALKRALRFIAHSQED